jgi:queuosine precursor transporter
LNQKQPGLMVSYRFVVIAALFVTCLITANIIAVKIISLGWLIVPAAVIVFPVSYIFGDVLTEVYGYQLARRVIWLGFGCNLLFVFFAFIGQLLPGAPFWQAQDAYVSILGYAPRLLAASACGYLVGEFANSFVLSKMKILTRGRWLWTRTIGSTVIGEALDSAIFIVLAFIGTPSYASVMIFYHWVSKTAIEIIATPVTYRVVNYLKKTESLDTFDYRTSFTPFSMKVDRTETQNDYQVRRGA